MYTTKRGDTLDAIAIKFKTTSDKIRIANFLGEILPTGTTIFLPDAQKPSITITRDGTAVDDDDTSGTFTLKLINPK